MKVDNQEWIKLNQNYQLNKQGKQTLIEVLKEKDDVIAELNAHLHDMENKINNLVSQYEHVDIDQVMFVDLQELTSTRNLNSNQGRYTLLIDVTDIVNNKQPFLKLDAKTKIIKLEQVEKHGQLTEQLTKNYLSLLEELLSVQKVIEQKDEEAKSIIQSLKKQITQASHLLRQKQEENQKKVSSALQESDKLLEQNQMLREQLQQLKKQLPYRKKNMKDQVVSQSSNSRPGSPHNSNHSSNHNPNRHQKLFTQMEKLKIANEALQKQKTHLVQQNNRSLDEVQSLKNKLNKINQQNQEFRKKLFLLKQKNNQNQPIQLNDQVLVNKMIKQTSCQQQVNEIIQAEGGQYHSLAQNNKDTHSEYPQVSPLVFPEANTIHKKQIQPEDESKIKQKHKPKRLIRIGY